MLRGASAVHTAVRAQQLINAFRDHGHSIARLDPLELNVPSVFHRDLRLSTYGFTASELCSPVNINGTEAAGFAADSGSLSVRELHKRLVQIYSSTMGIETVHCMPKHMTWLQEALETIEAPSFTPEQKVAILHDLSRANAFESHLSSRYASVKRFSIEGAESVIVGLNEVLERAAMMHGVTEVVMGMSHRGRLNVLANVAKKPIEAILHEFRGSAVGTLADENNLREQSDRAFDELDVDRKGGLTVDALQRALHVLGIDSTWEEAHAAVTEFDVDSSGSLSKDAFFQLALRLLGRSYSGDVKYHLGITQKRAFADGRELTLTMLPNPSHLEAVYPLVIGLARAKQLRLGAWAKGGKTPSARGRNDKATTLSTSRARRRVLPIVLHGDASFAAQGVVFETIGLSDLYAFHTGGVVHVILNNQIGFTTTPKESRGPSTYCTDVAKAIRAPIFHVNGDDPEAVVHACRIALDFRQRFFKDVVLDVVCYRRHGHQEADNPMFTQPRMYSKIRLHPSTRELYAARLDEEGVFSRDESEQMRQAHLDELRLKQTHCHDHVPRDDDWLVDTGAPFTMDHIRQCGRLSTGVALERLERLAKSITIIPSTLSAHRVVDALYRERAAMLRNDSIDWALAEQLAWAVCLTNGVHVRMSGQDVERGTFSHRHAVIHHQNPKRFEETYVPLQHIAPDQAPFEICNSSLSEFAVLGFELGYTLDQKRSLVMWEAQFGDFANTAQPIIDQFLCSAESKWRLQSGLVMVLPHGLEGAGPEHSSARLERFLQMCDDDERELQDRSGQVRASNWQIVNVTTPANYFHVLLRQVSRPFRKPLIVMAPKQLLRHKAIRSPVKSFLPGTRFERVICDDPPDVEPIDVTRLVICSGRVWLDLLGARQKAPAGRTIAILRLEQIAPFPYDRLASVLERFPCAELVWAQEEPLNAGAWSYVRPRINNTAARVATQNVSSFRTVSYVGRRAAAAPATGLIELHQLELQELLNDAMR